MGDTTPRVGLLRPGGGSTGVHGADEFADIDGLNGNFDLIDAALYPSVPNLTALVALLPDVPEGAVVSVGNFTLSGVYYHARSTWQKNVGTWKPVSPIQLGGDNSITTAQSAVAALVAFQTANYSSMQWSIGQRVITNSVEFRWDSAFNPWNSQWSTYTPTWTGATATATARWRYHSGRVVVQVANIVLTTIGSGTITMSLPVAADNGGIPLSTSLWNIAAVRYIFFPDFFTQQVIQWRYASATGQGSLVSGTSPAALVNGTSSVYVHLVYDPA